MTYSGKKYPYFFHGISKTSDYTIQEEDYAIGVNTSFGDVIITIPTASTISEYPQTWIIKKMNDDSNDIIIKLQTASDSMYGSNFYAMKLSKQGEGIEVVLNKNQRYTFNTISGIIGDYIVVPMVTTLTPFLSGTTLSLLGNLDDIGVETSVDVYFRYRKEINRNDWSLTSSQSKIAVGSFTDTITVTSGNIYRAQAVVKLSNGNMYYGDVLDTTINYYPNTIIASDNKLKRYWALQETTGTNTVGSEAYGKNMTFYNGVTISSDTINSQTIYKRVFGTNDYGQTNIIEDFSAHTYTILIQVNINSNSGDHTIFSFGRNILSLASDGSDIQLECNGSIKSWTSAIPFSGILNLFIVNNRIADKCILYSVNSSSRTKRIEFTNNSADAITSYFRVGRGASGDSSHQDTEYMDDGEIRSIAIWGKKLTASEMKDICNVLDNDGGLIVS